MGLQGMMKPPPVVDVDLAAKFASGKQSSRASSLASATPTDAMQRTQSEMAAQRAKGAEQVRELSAMTPPSAASKGQSGGTGGKSGIPRSSKGAGRWKQRASARSKPGAQPAAVPSEKEIANPHDSESDEDEFLQSPQLQGSSHVEHDAAAPVASVAPALPSRDVAGTDAAQMAANPGPPLPARDLPPSATAATPAMAGVHARNGHDEAARTEADETKFLAETMEEAGGLEDPEAYEQAKGLYAQGLWMQAARLFEQAVGDADI